MHEEQSPRNSIEEPRTIGAISLGPMMNRQGGYYFMSLKTGRLLRRRSFTRVPMPEEVKQIVLNMGKNENAQEELTVLDRYEAHITDENGENQPEEEEEPLEHNETDEDSISSNEDSISSDEGNNKNDSDDNSSDSNDNDPNGAQKRIQDVENELQRVLDREINEIDKIDEDLDDILETHDEDINTSTMTEEENNHEEQLTRYGRQVKRPTLYEPSMSGKTYDEAKTFVTVLQKVHKNTLKDQYSLKDG